MKDYFFENKKRQNVFFFLYFFSLLIFHQFSSNFYIVVYLFTFIFLFFKVYFNYIFAFSFVVIRGHSWSFVVISGHSWSFVVTRGHSWSLVWTFRPDYLSVYLTVFNNFFPVIYLRFTTRASYFITVTFKLLYTNLNLFLHLKKANSK